MLRCRLCLAAALQHVDVMPAAMVALWDPLPGAKISSPFGWRIHPVFHTRLFHKGCDYESRAGTPVMAAADGLVEDVGRRGNYGNYILIRHSGRLETAYAHLAGFAPSVSAGTMVRRGEVIGYVGMTGVATGPHLYYEVIVDGRQIDPEGAAQAGDQGLSDADRDHPVGPYFRHPSESGDPGRAAKSRACGPGFPLPRE